MIHSNSYRLWLNIETHFCLGNYWFPLFKCLKAVSSIDNVTNRRSFFVESKQNNYIITQILNVKLSICYWNVTEIVTTFRWQTTQLNLSKIDQFLSPPKAVTTALVFVCRVLNVFLCHLSTFSLKHLLKNPHWILTKLGMNYIRVVPYISCSNSYGWLHK